MAVEKRMSITKILDSTGLLYILFLGCLAYPMMAPMGLPINVTPGVKKTYDYFQKMPAGSRMVVSMDFSMGSLPEFGSTTMVLLRYGLSRGFKVIFIEYGYKLGGSIQLAMVIDEATAKGYLSGYKYGVDYVNLGWQPGWEAAVALLAENFKGSIQPTDHYGNPTKGMLILEPINTIKDIDLWFAFSAYLGMVPELYLRQFQAKYGTKIMNAPTAGLTTMVVPFFTSGQLVGLLPSLNGGAEMEFLTGFKGIGLAFMDAVSFGHLFVFFLVIVGNIRYVTERYVKRVRAKTAKIEQKGVEKA